MRKPWQFICFENKDASEFIFLKILMRYHVNFHIQQKPALEDNLQRQL